MHERLRGSWLGLLEEHKAYMYARCSPEWMRICKYAQLGVSLVPAGLVTSTKLLSMRKPNCKLLSSWTEKVSRNKLKRDQGLALQTATPSPTEALVMAAWIGRSFGPIGLVWANTISMVLRASGLACVKLGTLRHYNLRIPDKFGWPLSTILLEALCGWGWNVYEVGICVAFAKQNLQLTLGDLNLAPIVPPLSRGHSEGPRVSYRPIS
eukprot:5991844-Amphidinium_carterae.1